MKWAPGSTDSVLWSCVLSYLWSSELLSLLRCSKGHRELLTYEIVFQSVMLRGGHSGNSRTTLQIIMNLAKIGKIYVPSPMRLLRLCCGKRCENSGCTNMVSHVRPEFGMFFCWNCVVLHGSFEITPDYKHNMYYFLHERTAKQYKKGDLRRFFVWNSNQYDRSGEQIGPVITVKKVDSYIASKQGSSSSSSSSRSYGLVPEFVTSLESVPKLSQEVFDLYKALHQKSEIFHKNLKLEVAKASEARLEKKRAQFENLKSHILSELRSQLEGLPWASVVMRSLYLSRRLKPFEKAPSKGNKKMIQAIVQDCVACFTGVAKSGFLEFGFQELLSPSEDVLKNFLHHYYTTRYGNKTPQKWKEIVALAFDSELQLISDGQLHILALKLFTTIPDLFHSKYADQRHHNLARNAFCELSWKYSMGVTTEEEFRGMGVLFERASSLYEEVVLIAEEFLSCSWMTAEQVENMEKTEFVTRGGKEEMAKQITFYSLRNRYVHVMLRLVLLRPSYSFLFLICWQIVQLHAKLSI